MSSFGMGTTCLLEGLLAAGSLAAIVCESAPNARAHQQAPANKPELAIYTWKEGASDSEMVGKQKEIKKLSGGGVKVYVLLEELPGFPPDYTRVRIKLVNETQQPLHVDPMDSKLEIIEPAGHGPISAVPEEKVEKKVGSRSSDYIAPSNVFPLATASTLGGIFISGAQDQAQAEQVARQRAEAQSAQRAREQSKSKSSNENLNENLRKEMRASALREQTIAPGGSVLGVIYFARNKKEEKVVLHVRAGGNQYDFPLDVSH